MRKILALCLALVLTFLVAGCANRSDTEADTGGSSSPLAGKRVAYIMQMAPSDIFQMWSESAKQTAEALGMEFQAFFCNGSDSNWQDTVSQCAAAGYDGLLLSHGGQNYSYTFLTDLLSQYPDLKIVTFDTQFRDLSGETQKIPGVTQFFQQDSRFSELLLDYICNTLYPLPVPRL